MGKFNPNGIAPIIANGSIRALVQTVLPTVYDDSLSYFEVLGKVIKAVNTDTENVNTLAENQTKFFNDLTEFVNENVYAEVYTIDWDGTSRLSNEVGAKLEEFITNNGIARVHFTGDNPYYAYLYNTVNVSDNPINKRYWFASILMTDIDKASIKTVRVEHTQTGFYITSDTINFASEGYVNSSVLNAITYIESKINANSVVRVEFHVTKENGVYTYNSANKTPEELKTLMGRNDGKTPIEYYAIVDDKDISIPSTPPETGGDWNDPTDIYMRPRVSRSKTYVNDVYNDSILVSFTINDDKRNKEILQFSNEDDTTWSFYHGFIERFKTLSINARDTNGVISNIYSPKTVEGWYNAISELTSKRSPIVVELTLVYGDPSSTYISSDIRTSEIYAAHTSTDKTVVVKFRAEGKTYTFTGDAVNNTWTADAKATGDEIGDLKSALFNDEGTNLITSSNIRNSAGSGSNYITIDKTKLAMLWHLQISRTTDTSAITLSSNPLNLNTNKEYVFFAHLKSLSDHNVSQGAIGVQYSVDGQTPQYVTSAYALRFAQVMDGYVRGVFKPNRTTGYIRFVFDGMASEEKVVNLMIDQLYFGEMPVGYAPSEVYGAIKNLNNPVDKLYMTKDADYINADLLCWGDSLTAGAGGNGITYPDVCASELDLSVLNCGVGGEDCNTIAARQGGNNVVIPEGSVNGTYAHLYDIFGYELTPLLQGDGNNSGREIIVNGLNCQLVRSSGNYVISGYNGDALSVPTLARFAGSDFTGKIVTIWIGTNGGSFPGTSAGIDMRIAWINSMIKHIGHERYVILGLTVGEETASFYINEENRMKQAFGNKYFPTRKYLIESGLTIAGITPTSQDETDIAAGKVPTSLKSDSTHLNASGYTAVGKLLANKIRSLGYV